MEPEINDQVEDKQKRGQFKNDMGFSFDRRTRRMMAAGRLAIKPCRDHIQNPADGKNAPGKNDHRTFIFMQDFMQEKQKEAYQRLVDRLMQAEKVKIYEQKFQ